MGSALLTIIGVIFIAIAAAVVFVFLFVPLIKLLGKLVAHVFGTIGKWITDIFRLVGTILVIPVFMLLTVASVVLGRWSASGHYGRAVSGEIKSAGLCVYRIAIGHPLRLVGLHALIDGFERRLPEVVAAAPGRDKPRGRKNQFEGYTVVGSLAGGGSGGKLYIAQPDELKHAAFIKRGIGGIDQVVIKTFSVHEGSTLPQIIRESRALDAAKRLGLILEHDLTNERFFYVMRYIPGEPLSIVTQRLHADAGPEGLGDAAINKLLGYGRDVLLTLNRYHTGGLWHKDIKPDNIIVDHDQAEAHIVDLGLITPLRSAMTLTTHGTEYFRDPELVRMALKGVKVNEVNGEKFDIYAAAAVMYATIEGSFPAHGGLSQITKRCPEAIRWIIRRGMTDYDKRYDSVADMLRDLDVVLQANSPFDVKPVALPSVGGKPIEDEPESQPEPFAAAPPPRPEPAAPDAAEPTPPRPASAPRVRVANWWSGRYDIEEPGHAGTPHHGARGFEADLDETLRQVDEAIDQAVGAVSRATPRPAPRHPRDPSRRPAHEQLKNARARAAERQHRARTRVSQRRRSLKKSRNKAAGLNPGVAIALGCAVGLVSIPVSLLLLNEPSISEAPIAAARSVPGPIGAQVLAHAEAHNEARAEAHTDARATPAPPSPPALIPAIANAAEPISVLVVSTFNQPVDPHIEAGIQQTVAALHSRGFHVADVGTSAVARPKNAERAIAVEDDTRIELVAAVRAARGLGSTKANDAARSMQAWFDDAQLEYNALILIEPDPDSLAQGEPFARAIIVDDDSYAFERVLNADQVADRLVQVIDD